MLNEKGGVIAIVAVSILTVTNALGSLALYNKLASDNARSTQQIELLRQQIAATQPRATSTVAVVAPQKANAPDGTDAGLVEYKPYTRWEFAFSYPETFSAVPDSNEVRLTSQPGTLFRSSGGPAQPGATDFTSGYEMIIAKIGPGSDPVGDARLLSTSNPLVQKIDSVCDGAGCNLGEYLVTTKKGRCLITVNAQNYRWTDIDTTGIINTIKE